jgi:hypothetical protein
MGGDDKQTIYSAWPKPEYKYMFLPKLMSDSLMMCPSCSIAVGVDLLHIPVWLHLQVNVDLLKGN